MASRPRRGDRLTPKGPTLPHRLGPPGRPGTRISGVKRATKQPVPLLALGSSGAWRGTAREARGVDQRGRLRAPPPKHRQPSWGGTIICIFENFTRPTDTGAAAPRALGIPKSRRRAPQIVNATG